MERAGRAITLSLLLGWLAGCATSPQRQPLPEGLVVPEAWTAGPVETAETGPLWWDAFVSEELAAMLNEAFAANPDLLSMAERVEMAAATARIAGAGLYPSLSAGLEGSRQDQAFVGLPFDIPEFNNRIPTALYSTQRGVFSTFWELDLWGRVRAARSAAWADSEAALADLAVYRLSLAAQTSKAWVAAAAARQQHELALASAEVFRSMADTMKDRFDRGTASALELRLSLSTSENAEAMVQQRRRLYYQARQQIELLLGRYPAGQFEIKESMPALTGNVPVGIPSAMLLRRPDLQAAERRLAAADQRLWEARASLFPRLSLSASVGSVSENPEDFINAGTSVWALAGNLSQPIFRARALQAGVDLSRAKTRAAVLNYKSSILNAFGEVESALANEQILAEWERRFVQAHREMSAVADLAKQRYESGLAEWPDVLDYRRRELEVASQLLDIHRSRLINRIELFLALGGKMEQAPGAEKEEAK